jgi:hypothetical protein
VLFDTRPFGTAGEGPVAQAVEAVITALVAREGIGPVDVAHVAVVRVLADAIDNDARRPDVTAYTIARATRQLAEFLDALRARSEPPPAAAAVEADPFAAIVAGLATPSTVDAT